MLRAALVAISVLAVAGCSSVGGPAGASTTRTVSGIVFEPLNGSRAPIAGASVQVGAQTVTTDGQGAFVVSAVPQYTFGVVVKSDGYVTASRVLAPTGDVRFEIGLDRYVPPRLFGTISENPGGGPIEGVLVELFSCRPNCAQYADTIVTTDRNGFYSLDVAYEGPFNYLYVSKSGYGIEAPLPISACDGCDRIVTVVGDTRVDLRLIRQ